MTQTICTWNSFFQALIKYIGSLKNHLHFRYSFANAHSQLASFDKKFYWIEKLKAKKLWDLECTNSKSRLFAWQARILVILESELK